MVTNVFFRTRFVSTLADYSMALSAVTGDKLKRAADASNSVASTGITCFGLAYVYVALNKTDVTRRANNGWDGDVVLGANDVGIALGARRRMDKHARGGNARWTWMNEHRTARLNARWACRVSPGGAHARELQ